MWHLVNASNVTSSWCDWKDGLGGIKNIWQVLLDLAILTIILSNISLLDSVSLTYLAPTYQLGMYIYLLCFLQLSSTLVRQFSVTWLITSPLGRVQHWLKCSLAIRINVSCGILWVALKPWCSLVLQTLLDYNCLWEALKGIKTIFRPWLRISKEILRTREAEEPSPPSTAEAQGMEVPCKEQIHSVKRSREIKWNMTFYTLYLTCITPVCPHCPFVIGQYTSAFHVSLPSIRFTGPTLS